MTDKDLIGQSIDRYRVEELLGEGGFGSVYRARHIMMNRIVALKLLHKGQSSPEMRERFIREAQAVAQINSPHIVQMFDCGITDENQPFIAMELLDGHDLEHRLATEGVTVGHAIELTLEVLDGLGAAHAAGIVHRDLKPANVFLKRGANGDEVRLLDFGISKIQSEAVRSLTQTGVVMGTPHYMSPELFRGAKDADHRVDIYAVAVMLFEMLSAHTPHHADTYEQMVLKVVTEPPISLEAVAPHVPPALVNIVERGLAKDPNARFQSVSELRDALLHFRANAPATLLAHNGPRIAQLEMADTGFAQTGRPVDGGTQPMTTPAIGRTAPIPLSSPATPAHAMPQQTAPPTKKSPPFALFGFIALGAILLISGALVGAVIMLRPGTEARTQVESSYDNSDAANPGAPATAAAPTTTVTMAEDPIPNGVDPLPSNAITAMDEPAPVVERETTMDAPQMDAPQMDAPQMDAMTEVTMRRHSRMSRMSRSERVTGLMVGTGMEAAMGMEAEMEAWRPRASIQTAGSAVNRGALLRLLRRTQLGDCRFVGSSTLRGDADGIRLRNIRWVRGSRAGALCIERRLGRTRAHFPLGTGEVTIRFQGLR